jgi:hypothetical protein
MTRSTIVVAAWLAFAAILQAAPAQAQTRAFVSVAGNDSNSCVNAASPCRHFQQAYNKMPNGGEIDVLDPANYGSLTVTHTLGIVGRGWATLSPVAGQAAITINASSSDAITISGVQLDGAGISNTNGIVFNSGGSLTVTDCVARNFSNNGANATGNGILIQPTTGSVNFVITNTTVSNNALYGIVYQPASGAPSTIGVIDHVTANANTWGIVFYTGLMTTNSGATIVNVSNSLATGNVQGVHAEVGANTSVFKASIDNVTAFGNSEGIVASSNTLVVIGRSTITGNGTGVFWSPNTLISYGNNQVTQNIADFDPAPPPPVIATR